MCDSPFSDEPHLVVVIKAEVEEDGESRLLELLVVVGGGGEAAEDGGDGAGVGDLAAEIGVVLGEGVEVVEGVELGRRRGGGRGRREEGEEGVGGGAGL